MSESAACLGRWKRVLWGGTVRPSTSWRAEGAEGDEVGDRNRFASSRSAFYCPSPEHSDSRPLLCLLPCHLISRQHPLSLQKWPLCWIQLLLLIPFKPSPTRFPGQLLFCLKPSSGFPSQWEENICSWPQSHVQSTPRFIWVSDLIFTLPTAHQPHEPSFCSLRRPSSSPGASIYCNSCPACLERASSWWFPQSSSSYFFLFFGLPERIFLAILLYCPIFIFSIAFYHHLAFSLKASFRRTVFFSILFYVSFPGTEKYLAYKRC